MEELLRYSLLRVVVIILILEAIILVGCAIAIFLIKYYSDRKKRMEQERKDILSQHIMEALQNKKEPTLPKEQLKFKSLIETLENFDRRFSGSEWEEVKDKIIDWYLLDNAHAAVESSSWVMRQLAARCFLLSPKKATKEELSNLLDDQKFLVRVVAANAIVKSPNRELVENVVKKMATETSLSRFSYRDALINADGEKFQWIEEMAEKEKDPNIAALCLDILSTRTTHNLFPLAKNNIYSKDKQCKLESIKILKNLPSKETSDLLMHSLTDNDWEIRAEGVKALAEQHATGTAHQIYNLLSDNVWFVRLQAALALKKFDQHGMMMLSSINQISNPKAYEIAQYVLSLP